MVAVPRGRTKFLTPEERTFWLKFRRGMIVVNDAIEEYLSVGKHEPEEKSLASVPERRANQTSITTQSRSNGRSR